MLSALSLLVYYVYSIKHSQEVGRQSGLTPNPIPYMIRGMSRQVNRHPLQPAHLKHSVHLYPGGPTAFTWGVSKMLRHHVTIPMLH